MQDIKQTQSQPQTRTGVKASHSKEELFARMSVPRALMKLAVPTVISQLVTMVYNLADTYFVGRSGDPLMVAAVSACYVLLFFMNAMANLFGIGGGSQISRMLGEKDARGAARTAMFSVYGSLLISAVYVLICTVFATPILDFLGASEATMDYCREYAFYVVTLGGVPTVVSLTLSHLLRNEGYATEASFGLGLGGVLNMLLDPLFIFVLVPAGQQVKGAAIATMLSNCVTLIYFVVCVLRLRDKTVITFNPGVGLPDQKHIKKIFAIGLPSALASGLAATSNMVLTHIAEGFGDICVAAAGIVKKIDMLPMNTGMGLCQGMIPLVAYNYAAGNFKRMRAAMRTARYTGIAFAAVCIVCFEIWAEPLVRFFLDEPETVALGARLLRIAVLATPLTITCFQLNYAFQAVGRGTETLLFSISRQGIVHIPLLFLMAELMGSDGLMASQIVSDIVTLLLGFLLWHFRVEKELRLKENAL